MSLLEVFISETIGTALLITLGVGVVATTLLTKSKGKGTGWLLINFGWGFAVMIGVYGAWKTGGHLNPAVTLGIAATGAEEFVPGVAITAASILTYIAGQMVGAMIGATLAWLAFKDHYNAHENQAEILGTFATGPEIRNYTSNVITEAIGTFVLLTWVILSGATPTELGPLAVALVIVSIGASLGGPTGYAINPARDLGPRIMHAILPIKGKGGSDWAYSWVPIVGPIIGGVLAGLIFGANTLNLAGL
ncbi:aquaporin family protein [Arcanobacterium haemolyticum]|uniref:Major intrinsic protein n=1 Tax=Arcanobacterium haemolyticum (strain ATCC 9345 / DSM 20595 / CCM 5947 / CCUG 17215 / LMG 16163 / NBRC 15585 / NCTC 8452 / 11018) TaxID=644284 RepID=D7BM72_ARCHD|nr:MIP/aquaporin family protein [Arcanobacterium haemolyticum]ADH92021.1 major intrinsic protein [Arcanobacterium haemolyticum DSM 20595]QCX46195.1 aquaporin family protein [Arcanobacterium haemolyticum]SPT74904.1 Glyceroaquaporin [Arcanobacterium haemolyticum]SQH29275.1 Glyceroaquaporin [Arcanobacterium haemolyticum]